MVQVYDESYMSYRMLNIRSESLEVPIEFSPVGASEILGENCE